MDDRVIPAAAIPLVVDLDGALFRVNSQHEAIIQLWSRQPLRALDAILAVRRGRSAFSAVVAGHLMPDIATAPIDEAVFDTIKRARREGRKVYLSTAADRRLGEAVAASIGEFDGVFATENGSDLAGQEKANQLVAAFGPRGFDYVGNAGADMPVWRAARTAMIAGAAERLVQRLDRERPDAIVLSRREFSPWPYFMALRPHQWLKNGLVGLPAIAGHDFSLSAIVMVIAAFASFSLGASSAYLINDMLDLPHDRAHVEKRHRPLAAGMFPLSHAMILCVATAISSLAVAVLLLPWTFLMVLTAYFGLTGTYAFYLKRKLMIDVVALAALYGLRVLAGGAATGIVLSHWLVGFCFFIFLCLALVKRTSEMIALPEDNIDKIKGRGYRRTDLPIITALTAASGFVAVLVLALYIASPDVSALYSRPELLWGICVVLVYWLGRAIFLTGRGEMRQDPVVFAAMDKISLMAGGVVVAVFLAAL
jgi:4-hydroxybenzoate polyprenyltransferase